MPVPLGLTEAHTARAQFRSFAATRAATCLLRGLFFGSSFRTAFELKGHTELQVVLIQALILE